MAVYSRANSVVAKRLWNFLRISYFMMRKGLVSKRKLIMDMNLMMKRGKLVRKTLGNLMFHHHSKNVVTRGSGFGLQEYEFSCSNSPHPVFFHLSKRKHHYFPCINPPGAIEEECIEEPQNKAVVLVPKFEYSPFPFGTPEFAHGEKFSPLTSPFAVRLSNYSDDDDDDDDDVEEVDEKIDDDAEEFIRRFYEQLRVQSRTQLIQHQEMLARGTR